MNGIGTAPELIAIIKRLQDAIKKKTDQNLKFVFCVDENGKIVLEVPRGFRLELQDKNKQKITKTFVGSDFSGAIREFLDFFSNGGEGKITADEEGFQFEVQFHLDSDWVTDYGYVGHYDRVRDFLEPD